VKYEGSNERCASTIKLSSICMHRLSPVTSYSVLSSFFYSYLQALRKII